MKNKFKKLKKHWFLFAYKFKAKNGYESEIAKRDVEIELQKCEIQRLKWLIANMMQSDEDVEMFSDCGVKQNEETSEKI
ncbi:MAG: hypothetical protein [Bacteriophage sp.]|nr:MAG: hypothetical protein [Bacteriophage sp.]